MLNNATFNGINLGDHAEVSIDTGNEVEIHKIPRADGAIIRRRGGGLKNLTVTGWIVKSTRAEIEQFFDQLAASLGSGLASLIINGETYTNCLLVSISPDTGHNRFADFTLSFIKSG